MDIADYRAEVDELGLDEDQAREFLEMLWSIMASFVRLGIEVDICGQIFPEVNCLSDDWTKALRLLEGFNQPGDAIRRPAQGVSP